ncbi:hypothetical protein A3F34_00135 [Candidatus Roizmanbacteria bacterium RIFCSPHIGHO2_12_FULL_44_10]|uniref:Uncharacterized protein n=1 Tax=Candidatus Roizmanbacteria bacterium RIFCSPHIGHO2_12_FULL_44_10 TaxID=1802054 RepID=A0A1F7I513_9BACT|nr:MAG: hypothetical protein A3F34_00135 [Candidatus Roizmanbacteria bacterium RIFCSPHIGHO2_12_FULL_44_10]
MQDEYEKSRIKELKLFQELLLYPDFKKAILSLRTKYRIPIKGFDERKHYVDWWENQQKTKREFIVNTEVVSLNENDQPKIIKKGKTKIELTSFDIDVYKILRNHDLSLEWHPYISSHICLNEHDKVNVHEAVLLKYTYQGLPVHEQIQFYFGATMGIKHLNSKFHGKTIWGAIIEPLQQLMQGYSEKKRRPKKSKIKLQARISRLYSEGKRDVDIASMPNFPDVSPQTIRKHKSRFKKKLLTKNNR